MIGPMCNRFALGGALTAALLLAACGGADGGERSSRAPDSGARKQRTLSRVEYRLMRDFLNSNNNSVGELQSTCNQLDAGPDTQVIRAARKGCNRSVTLYGDSQAANADMSACMGEDFECIADAAEPLRQGLVDSKRWMLTYNDDLAAVIDSGPCLEALQVRAEILERLDRGIEAFRQLRLDNREPLRRWVAEGLFTDVHDLTPCQQA